jgi:TolB-like protein/predicted Ser/Thr protein kinase
MATQHDDVPPEDRGGIEGSARTQSEQALQVGQRISRYRLVAMLGSGGMGEVYRAYDSHLERGVALKILRSGALADQQTRKRFRREALALSKLNHPNVATVFDFDTHEGLDFLVMEFIRGVPLTERLKKGWLPEAEILGLGTQLLEGLAAAHAQGVIHRDLKPGNLMITSDGRLKILDFGLAVLLAPAGDIDITRSRPETLAVVGTLPYMPPEQLRGQSVDTRSDIYSAGAVLYEMASGQRPFGHSNNAELISAILHETPPPPSSHGRVVSSSLESVCMRSLSKQPDQRYQSASELLTALREVGQQDAVTQGQPAFMPARTRSRKTYWIAVALVLAVLAAGFIALRMNRSTKQQTSLETAVNPISLRRSVAVLGFKNLSAQPDVNWLSAALSEMLTTELAAGEKLRTIPGEVVVRMKIDLALADADSFAKDTLAKIHSNIGTDLVVVGSYVVLRGNDDAQIRLDLRVQDAAAGETIATVTQTASQPELLSLVSRTGAELRRKLGLADLSPAQVAGITTSLPANATAARLYTEGLLSLRSSEEQAARDLLVKAVRLEPAFPLAHAALAAAWSGLGFDAKATEEAKQAFDLSSHLTREERLSVEGQYRELGRERDKAIEIYRTLFDFFPDNIDYGLRLAAIQTQAGKGAQALATVAMLRKIPSPVEDPRIDLAESDAAGSRRITKISKLLPREPHKRPPNRVRGSLSPARGWPRHERCKDWENRPDRSKSAKKRGTFMWLRETPPEPLLH